MDVEPRHPLIVSNGTIGLHDVDEEVRLLMGFLTTFHQGHVEDDSAAAAGDEPNISKTVTSLHLPPVSTAQDSCQRPLTPRREPDSTSVLSPRCTKSMTLRNVAQPLQSKSCFHGVMLNNGRVVLYPPGPAS